MKTSKPIGVKYLLMKKNLVTIGIIISGVLSIIMVLLTYYGSYSGNFIAVVDSQERVSSIMLSSTKDLEDAAPRLFADSAKNTTPLSFDDLRIKEAVSVDGNYFDPDFTYFAFSFYITNNGNQTLDVEARYLVTEVTRNADEAVRVIIVEDEDVDNINMYMKKDTVPFEYNPKNPEAKIFYNEDEGVVFSEIIEDFQPGVIKKYTVIIYIEGNDPDCGDDLMGGLIKTTFRFQILEPKGE